MMVAAAVLANCKEPYDRVMVVHLPPLADDQLDQEVWVVGEEDSHQQRLQGESVLVS